MRGRALLTRMRDTMLHRGPDDAGEWWSLDGRVGLAHRRLSIIDLSPAGTHRMLDTYFFIDDKGSCFARHKCMYDYTLMKATLEQAGFKAVSRCASRQGRMPDVELLDNRPEDSLFVEAIRPL